MYDGKMYFGTRGYMQWVKACDVSPDFSKVGWSTGTQFLNGGAAVRSSVASHKEYVMSWNTMTREQARTIVDYADGLFDTRNGVNLIYFLDPMTLDTNVLPQLWATPAQSLFGGRTLVPGQTPTPANNAPDGFGYPARSANYVANATSQTIWIPIPPGYTAWIGAHGVADTGAGVVATPTQGAYTLSPEPVTLIPAGTPTRVNKAVNGAQGGIDGVMLSFLNAGASSTASMTLWGMMVQILPTGKTPETGNFISGQGNSGCQFADKPNQSPRSLPYDSVSLSAKLIETGSWL